jgi:hypothetical protein
VDQGGAGRSNEITAQARFSECFSKSSQINKDCGAPIFGCERKPGTYQNRKMSEAEAS